MPFGVGSGKGENPPPIKNPFINEVIRKKLVK